MGQIGLETTLLIILMVLAVNLVFQAFKLPIILGYLIAGIGVGPHGLGLVTDIHAIQQLAEFGVVLLMFTIGLEFSLTRLIQLRYPVFVLGGMQVIASIAITVFIGFCFNMQFVESLVIGFVVAMSSTALVVKQLTDQAEAYTTYGINTIGVLLFQDLAFIPILVIISSLSGINHQPLLETLIWSFFRGLLAIVLILAIGRWLLQPLFHRIKTINATELFTLAALFVALGSAWITEQLGMTYALGAFLSGIMLGETEFRSQIQEEVRPFRDLLLGLFFVSIGMLANIATWGDTWFWIAITLFAMMFGKSILIILLSQASGYDRETSLRSGIILAEGGEFGFAILALALDNRLLPMSYGQVVLGALLISFGFAPLLIKYNGAIARKILKR
ncbi:cation:proton antiporter [Legionella yabuuchiae]|uniref:cation:proton antiporter domain-containing protein n=1 Tax=Legionella yabuuchiae TaxID=376727 RepID=UPI0010566E92|nr:cation:proton antiporter [Legionella yabuuchiae]